MNRFEMGRIENLPENETKKEGFENFEELQLIENEELSSVKDKSPASSRLKKAALLITAGVMLFSATPAFSQEKGEQLTGKQKLELQIQNLEEQRNQLEKQKFEIQQGERKEELNSYLNYFNIEGLELGEVKNKQRRPNEQFGIYLNGRHLGDICSDNGLNFSQEELIDDISKILKGNGIQYEKNKPQTPEILNAKININPEAQKILENWGGSIDLNSSTLNIGGPNRLEFDKNTKSIEILSVGDNMLIVTCEDFDGKRTIVTCVDKIIKNVTEIK